MNVIINKFCLCSQLLILHAYMCEQFKTTWNVTLIHNVGIHVHVSCGFLEIRGI